MNKGKIELSDLESLIRCVKDLKEDWQYQDSKKISDPSKQRKVTTNLIFWSSIHHYLTELETIKKGK